MIPCGWSDMAGPHDGFFINGVIVRKSFLNAAQKK